MSLEILSKLSNHFGDNPEFVLAGGGNTSFKDEHSLYVKPSGVKLADIKPEQFVKLERAKVRKIFADDGLADCQEREAVVKKMLADAVCFDSDGRPSVETPLHEIIPSTFVVHTHPALVNGLSCGNDGATLCAKLFPDALWVDYVDPGVTLALKVKTALDDYRQQKGALPEIIFLQNHGVFVGGDTEKAIQRVYDILMNKLNNHYRDCGVSPELVAGDRDDAFVFEYAPILRSLLGEERPATIVSLPPFKVATGPLTPDHIVYAKSFALECDTIAPGKIAEFKKAKGYLPKLVYVPGKAVFCAGENYTEALTVAALASDGAKVQALTAACGGCNYLDNPARKFIENWEVESYRKKVAGGNPSSGLDGKIAIVTGGAQGFGLGIARGLAAAGVVTVIADLNQAGAEAAATAICEEFGEGSALAVAVNIASEESVEAMCRDIVDICGGVDIFVANAGVLRAGSVRELSKKEWDFVTNVNYTGYFLCVKHVAQVMARQNKFSPAWTDIVQVNSKSGLVGSNRNGAYAGSKFGTIGLTQSFALELIEEKIKVNSICPGNFFDGPLWSDPERGLFVQYLNSNKVPGAKSIADVKKFYEAKIPMLRGCVPEDVVRAIVYCVEQSYETGQAIPVTGGQVMLN